MKIAITGGVGSGKSTVIEALKKQLEGVFTFHSVDQIVHDIWAKIEKGCERYVTMFFTLQDGSEMVISREVLDRRLGASGLYTQKAVSDFVWSSPENREKVEALINPIIVAELSKILSKQFVIVEFPTLFEKGDPRLFDLVINVTADALIRIERAMKRSGWSEEKANNVLKAQLSNSAKYRKVQQSDIESRYVELLNEPETERFKLWHGPTKYSRWHVTQEQLDNHRPPEILHHVRHSFEDLITLAVNFIKERSVPFLVAQGKKIGVIAGSFDPVTQGHLWMFKEVLSVMDHVIVLSAHNPKKTYFFDENKRNLLIQESISEFEVSQKARIHVVTLPSNELVVRYAANIGAKAIFRGIRNFNDFQDENTQLLVQRTIAPEINIFHMIPPRELTEISSSLVKGMLGLDEWKLLIKPYVSTPVLKAISRKLAIDSLNSKKV